MLKRVITALILIPLAVCGILYLRTDIFALILGLIFLAAAWEWIRLTGIVSIGAKVFYLILTGLTFITTYVLLIQMGLFWLFLLTTLWWVLVTLMIITYSPDSSWQPPPLVKAAIGLLVLVPTWAALVSIHGISDQGPLLLLFVITLIWVADSGAYFSGRRWGRIKLAPAISPGKSWEGVYGALAGVALWSGLLVILVPDIDSPLLLFLLSLLVCMASIVGDLFESIFKRQAGVKDSSNLLPGHGGVLDRVDSLTAAAPVYALGLSLL